MTKVPLYLQIVIALVLGVLAGAFIPVVAPYIEWLGNMFMNALCMLIVPIVFFSISTSVSNIGRGDAAMLKRIGRKTILYYVVTMLLAILTGLALVNLIKPGNGVSLAFTSEVPAQVNDTSVTDIVSAFIPSNILYSFAHNNTIPVIFIALLVGFFIPKLSEKSAATLTDIIEGGYELTIKLMKLVISFAPLGIFAIVTVQFAMVSDVMGTLGNMLLYVLTVAAGLLIHTFITLPLLLFAIGRVHPWKHFRNMGVPLLTAFSTASSGAALPLTLQAVKEKDGVSEEVSDFVVSLGATINMNGAALLECVAVIFIAQAYGVSLTFGQMILVSGTALLCAIGSAGIPMSALVMMAIILNVVGLPVEGIGLVIGVDRILDMLRTSVNVYGDTCVAVLVAKSEKEITTIDL